MHVAICIVGFRNCRDVSACLEAIGGSVYKDFEIVVCENGGSASFRALTNALPDRLPGGQAIRIIEAPRNLGYAGGVNVCVKASHAAEAWWILNPDTLPEPGALEALVRRLARGDCDLAGGVLYGADQRVQTLGGRWRPWLARAEAIGRGKPLNAPIDVNSIERQMDFVSGACMLVSRSFLTAVGAMREDYFLYCEEVEWCLRGTKMGMSLGLAPDAHVLHHQGSTTGSGAALRHRPRLQVYLDERNKIFVTRDRFPRRLLIAAPAALAIIALRYGAHRATQQARWAVQGWLAGLMGKRGRPEPAQPRPSNLDEPIVRDF